MKKVPIWFRTIVLIFAFWPAAGMRGAETIRLRADMWMPFNGEPGSETPGYAVELARRIFEPQGIVVEYQTMPWGDALKAAAAGQIEGVIGANRGEAAQLVVPQEEIGSPRVGMFVLKGSSWRYENTASLAKIRLGVVADYQYWPTLDSYIQKHEAPSVVRMTGDHPLADGIVKLKARDVDAFVEIWPVWVWNVKQAGLNVSDFQAAYLHEGENVYVAFSGNGHPGERYAKVFDDGLRKMRQSGELAKILEKYGQTDWKN